MRLAKDTAELKCKISVPYCDFWPSGVLVAQSPLAPMLAQPDGFSVSKEKSLSCGGNNKRYRVSAIIPHLQRRTGTGEYTSGIAKL